MTEVIAQVRDVSRSYGRVRALDRVDLDIHRGELLGLLGPNGAGKSTLVNLFTGLRKATSGRVEIFGADPRKPSARRRIGVTPQESALPATLKVAECVGFVAAHHSEPLPADELLSRFGLDGLDRRQIGGLSGGQKRRLSVALAFVGRPRLVLLDEPTTGLDVEARRTLWDGIRAFHADGGTVLLTSHYLPEIEELADRVVVLAQGRVLTDGSVAEVRGEVGLHRMTLTVDELPHLAGVRSVQQTEDGRTEVLTADPDRAVRDLVHSNVTFSGLEIQQTSLEDAFLTLVNAPRTPHTTDDREAVA